MLTNQISGIKFLTIQLNERSCIYILVTVKRYRELLFLKVT